jgi:hypothetical protein
MKEKERSFLLFQVHDGFLLALCSTSGVSWKLFYGYHFVHIVLTASHTHSTILFSTARVYAKVSRTVSLVIVSRGSWT